MENWGGRWTFEGVSKSTVEDVIGIMRKTKIKRTKEKGRGSADGRKEKRVREGVQEGTRLQGRGRKLAE